MRLVHLSDLHLGFRQYQRLTPGGVNQREADVAATFQRAIDMVIGLEPDLVIVAGDVFHSVRPTNQAILHSFIQFSRLVQTLPHIEVADPAAVMVSRAELAASRWSYVALGHYHVHREIESNAFYSGSLDYTSVNTWGELVEERAAKVGKGFVEYDLDSGTRTFHE